MMGFVRAVAILRFNHRRSAQTRLGVMVFTGAAHAIAASEIGAA
jgi:hypothetical protein